MIHLNIEYEEFQIYFRRGETTVTKHYGENGLLDCNYPNCKVCGGPGICYECVEGYEYDYRCK